MDILKEYLELGIDELLSDGLLKDIPVINTVFALVKFASNRRDRHQAEKILAFVESLSGIGEDEKRTFIQKLDKEDKKGRIYQQVMLQLDKLDEVLKAEMTGNLFRAYIQGKINRHHLLRCFSIIEKAYMSDLLELHRGFGPNIGIKLDEKESMKIFRDDNIPLNELNDNLSRLGILRADLALLSTRHKREQGMDASDYYAISSLNPLGLALLKHLFPNYQTNGNTV